MPSSTAGAPSSREGTPAPLQQSVAWLKLSGAVPATGFGDLCVNIVLLHGRKKHMESMLDIFSTYMRRVLTSYELLIDDTPEAKKVGSTPHRQRRPRRWRTG